MTNFDPYREALVVETLTEWPDDVAPTDDVERHRLEAALHADAAAAAGLEYVRLPTGFCRKITVTADDLARVNEGKSGSPGS